MKTKDEIIKEYGLEMYLGFGKAMQEYSDQQTKELREEIEAKDKLINDVKYEFDKLKEIINNEIESLKESKMWGCYACNKLLRIYATKEEADNQSTKWSTECTVYVKEVNVGDGGANN